MKVTKSVTLQTNKPKDRRIIDWLKRTGRYGGGAFAPFIRELLEERRLREVGDQYPSHFSLDDLRQLIRTEVGGNGVGGNNGHHNGAEFDVLPGTVQQAVAEALDARHLSLPSIRQTLEAIIKTAGVHAGAPGEDDEGERDDDSWIDAMMEEDAFL